MLIAKSPFRISFFGGSTDYESFYRTHGSFIIGTTIDKYIYFSMRKRPSILSNESVITYSKMEFVKDKIKVVLDATKGKLITVMDIHEKEASLYDAVSDIENFVHALILD